MNLYLFLFFIALSALTVSLILHIFSRKQYISLSLELKKNKEHLTQLNKLRESMLKITQAVVGTENPRDIYEMILEKSIAAIPDAHVGSVMIRQEDGMFHIISHKGYDDIKIENFSLPLEETILWKYTKGDIRKTELINDVSNIPDLEVKPLAVDQDNWQVQSTISVPLIIEKQIKGIVHIDSKEKYGFTREDLTSMEYIRSNIEIALQKYILYTKMVTLSRFDELTKAYNRTYFMEQFQHLLNKAERYKQSFTLVIFDINDLKKINDSCGHIAGDKILKQFSEVTLKNIRKTDIFARWGGDEFMGLFYEISKDEVSGKINKIRNSLKENPLSIENCSRYARFSSGQASYPEEGTDFDELLKTADNRMYINKREMKKE